MAALSLSKYSTGLTTSSISATQQENSHESWICNTLEKAKSADSSICTSNVKFDYMCAEWARENFKASPLFITTIFLKAHIVICLLSMEIGHNLSHSHNEEIGIPDAQYLKGCACATI